jgi:predicted Zn finger-like uncharacterized protein
MNMPIQFTCPHCQASLQATDNMLGKQGTCPKCKKEITVQGQKVETSDDKKESAKKE